MNCAFCKLDIDEDSVYCDQCGHEILICPKCGKGGKGKICTSDGTALISQKSKAGTNPLNESLFPASLSPPKPSVTPVTEISGVDELHLINKNLKLDLKIENNDIIGRKSGRFVNILSKYQQISSKHIRVNFDSQKGWIVTDLNSTNGTKYNNVKLVPMQPQSLSDQSYLLIANIEFYVQITNNTLCETGTIRI